MNIKFIESTTLSAINKLVNYEMPFVAATLCYVMLERCLKLYLLNKRHTLTASDIDICARVGNNKLRFKDYSNEDEAKFTDEFLNTLQLGGLEIVFRIQAEGIKDSRNKLFHSGLYLSSEKEMVLEDRQNQNWIHYETAAKQLSHCSISYFNTLIVFNEAARLLNFKAIGIGTPITECPSPTPPQHTGQYRAVRLIQGSNQVHGNISPSDVK